MAYSLESALNNWRELIDKYSSHFDWDDSETHGSTLAPRVSWWGCLCLPSLSVSSFQKSTCTQIFVSWSTSGRPEIKTWSGRERDEVWRELKIWSSHWGKWEKQQKGIGDGADHGWGCWVELGGVTWNAYQIFAMA